MTLVPRVLELLHQAGLGDVGVMVGGIVPEEDAAKLIEMGVGKIFGPGTALDEIVAFLRQRGSRTHAG
jgi:methylmalonyl-CoA mutase C-terminal domain/subunit